MRMRQAAVAALALAAFSCFPGSAGAKVGHGRPPARQWIDIELEGSNGYSIHIGVNPRRHLILQVTKERFSAEYMTRDVLAGAGRVNAKLLGLGRISVRFHPRGPVRHPSLPCRGKRPRVQPGVVRGTIRFVGEREYTQVEVREAEAAIEEPKSRLCRYGAKFEPHPREREWVSKFETVGVGADFLARKYLPGVIEGGEVLYFAETGEAFETASGQRLPLTIYRYLLVPASASTFSNAHPEHLAVSPPPPFSGTGILARTPESVFTWGGDLSVQFPGLDPIPLAGPNFESADYCLRKSGCVGLDVNYR